MKKDLDCELTLRKSRFLPIKYQIECASKEDHNIKEMVSKKTKKFEKTNQNNFIKKHLPIRARFLKRIECLPKKNAGRRVAPKLFNCKRVSSKHFQKHIQSMEEKNEPKNEVMNEQECASIALSYSEISRNINEKLHPSQKNLREKENDFPEFEFLQILVN